MGIWRDRVGYLAAADEDERETGMRPVTISETIATARVGLRRLHPWRPGTGRLWRQSLVAAVGAGLLASCPIASPAADQFDYYAGRWPKGLLENVHKHHLGQGEDKLARGAYQYALNDAKFILNRFPNDPKGLHLMMRIALRASGNDLLALPYFKSALETYPQHAETWLLYGIYLHRLGRFEKAVDAYKSALERNNRSAETHYNLGLALVELGRLREANQAAQRAYEMGYPLPGLRDRLREHGAWKVGTSAEGSRE